MQLSFADITGGFDVDAEDVASKIKEKSGQLKLFNEDSKPVTDVFVDFVSGIIVENFKLKQHNESLKKENDGHLEAFRHIGNGSRNWAV